MGGLQAGARRCERCMAGGPTATAGVAARRRLLKAAVFRPEPGTQRQDRTGGPADRTAQSGLGTSAGFGDMAGLPGSAFGTIADVSPHVLVLRQAGRERRFVLSPDATAWRGAQLDPVELQEGDQAVVRLRPSRPDVADRIWANIGRVTGVIIERSGSMVVVDEGSTRKPQVVTIWPRSLDRVRVRFPTLEPGFLLDIIGLRIGGILDGTIPATAQPGYPVHRLPAPAPATGHVPDSISGTATWHEPRDEPAGATQGVAYPALDPHAGCAEDEAGARPAFARMPYLAIGSMLRVRNECSGTDCLLPVTGCAPMARLFNDRCVTCGTSPRGRVADLTVTSFIALGGELEQGCFNASIAIGQ